MEPVSVEYDSAPKLTPPGLMVTEEVEMPTFLVMEASVDTHPTCVANQDSHHGLTIDNFISGGTEEQSLFNTKSNAGACSVSQMIFEVIHGSCELKAYAVSTQVKAVKGSKSVGYIEST